MKKWFKIGLAITLFSSVNFAYAENSPQRFEGCFLEGSKICLFKDGTAIFETQYEDKKTEYDYDYYRYVENWHKAPHTHQAILFESTLTKPAFIIYAGENPNLTQGFQLTLVQFDKGYSQDEIIVDGEKLDFNTAKVHPKLSHELQFTFSHAPKKIILKKFIKDAVYPTTSYQLNNNHNTILITSHRGSSSEIDFPVTYQNGKLAMDFGKWGKHPFPFMSPNKSGKMWQEFLEVKAIKQRLADYDKHIYVDKKGWYGYQRDWTQAEEMESKLTDEQSAQISQEIDEKLKNAGLIKLDLLKPKTVESSVK